MKIPQILTLIHKKVGTKWEHFLLRAKKSPLRNHPKGLCEVPGGFEPPYTVLQTAD